MLGPLAKSQLWDSNTLIQQLSEEEELAVTQATPALNPHGVILHPYTDCPEPAPVCDWCTRGIPWVAEDAIFHQQQEEEQEGETEEQGGEGFKLGRVKMKRYKPQICPSCQVANYCSVACRDEAAEHHLPFCRNLLAKLTSVRISEMVERVQDDVPAPAGGGVGGTAAAEAAARVLAADVEAESLVRGDAVASSSLAAKDYDRDLSDELKELLAPATADGVEKGVVAEPLTSTVSLAGLASIMGLPAPKPAAAAGGGGGGGGEVVGGGSMTRRFKQVTPWGRQGEDLRDMFELCAGGPLVLPCIVDGHPCLCPDCTERSLKQMGYLDD